MTIAPVAGRSSGRRSSDAKKRLNLVLILSMIAVSIFITPTGAAAAGQGTVVAWGGNTFGEQNVPAGLTGVVQIAAGKWHALAVKSDGTVVGWGLNSDGQANPPAGLNQVKMAAGGLFHSLALKTDGTVVAWGSNSDGQLNIPAGLSDVVAVSAGAFHSLALKADGTVVAWGSNAAGQLNVPAGLTGVVAIAAGEYHNLALKSDGTVVSWGQNDYGKATVPSGLAGVTAIAAGNHTSLALRSDGTVVAWGNDTFGATDVPPGLDHVVAVAAGAASYALRSDGTVTAWGYNGEGETNVPAGLNGVTAIAANQEFALALQGGSTVTAPAPPPAPTATAGDASADVTWSAPSDGGSPITNYVVTSSGGQSVTVDGSTLAAHVTGLTNGTAYTFTVVARNAIGDSASSPPSNSVTPVGRPAAPAMPTATAGDASADVSWSAPSDGGSPITNYVVTSSGGQTVTVDGSTLTAHFTGLTNGTAYTFTVVARNAIGDSPASPASNTVTPYGIPAKVTGVTATYGDGTVTLSWPAVNGNGSTPHYEVTGTAPEPPGTVSQSTADGVHQVTFTTLPHCVPWSFTVLSVNAAGAATLASDPVTGVIAAPSQTVLAGDNAYTPQGTISSELCRRVTYSFPISLANKKAHSVTDAMKLGASSKATQLFDSGLVSPGGPSFTYLFQGAGFYNYHSTAKGDIYTGALGLAANVTPNTGSTAATFDVRWGYRMASWLVFDVDYRFLKAGKTTWPTTWTSWKTGQTGTHATFSPATYKPTAPFGPGKYQFRVTVRGPVGKSAPSADLPISYLTVS
jgi:hypothetical protein